MSKEELEIVKNMIEYFQGKIDTGYHKIFYNDLDSDFKTVDGINVLNKVLEQQKEIKELKDIEADYIRRRKTCNQILLKQGYISKDKIRELIKEIQETMCPMCCECGLCEELEKILEENTND